MTTTITVTIPARSVKLRGATKTTPARVETLRRDGAGQWSIDVAGHAERLTEAEAIDVLRKASDWDAIRREYFPMHGFHS